MGLEWIVLGYAAAAEALMILSLTLPGINHLRKGLISLSRNMLKPLLWVIPYCLFLLLDIYWKYETRPSCDSSKSCSAAELLRYQKSVIKSQRNGLLVAAALLLYWLLYAVTQMVVKVEVLNQRVEKEVNRD